MTIPSMIKSHLWITSMVWPFSTLQPMLMASHTAHILTGCLSDHYLMFPAFFFCSHSVWYTDAWLYCINGFYLLGISSFLFLLWSVWIAKLLQIGFLCCIGESVAIFLAICIIGLVFLSWKLPPADCGLSLCWLHRWISNGEFFYTMEYAQGFPFYITIMGFYTG